MIDVDGWHLADVAQEAYLLSQGISYLAAVDKDGARYIAPLGTSDPGVPVETVWANSASPDGV